MRQAFLSRLKGLVNEIRTFPVSGTRLWGCAIRPMLNVGVQVTKKAVHKRTSVCPYIACHCSVFRHVPTICTDHGCVCVWSTPHKKIPVSASVSHKPMPTFTPPGTKKNKLQITMLSPAVPVQCSHSVNISVKAPLDITKPPSLFFVLNKRWPPLSDSDTLEDCRGEGAWLYWDSLEEYQSKGKAKLLGYGTVDASSPILLFNVSLEVFILTSLSVTNCKWRIITTH